MDFNVGRSGRTVKATDGGYMVESWVHGLNLGKATSDLKLQKNHKNE